MREKCPKMKGISHHVRRVLRSRLFIVIIVMILFAIVFMGLVSVAGYPSETPAVNFYDGLVEMNGTVYFDSFTSNYLGDPVSNESVIYTIQNFSSDGAINGAHDYYLLSSTSGYANATLGSIGSLNSSGFLLDSPIGTYFGAYPNRLTLQQTQIKSYAYSMGLVRSKAGSPYSFPMIVYFNQSGGRSPPISVYYAANDMAGYLGGSKNISLGSFSDFNVLTIPGQFGNTSESIGSFWATLKGNNSVISDAAGYVLSPPPGYSEEIALYGSVGPVGGFLLVVMAISVTEMIYTQDETNGAFQLSLSKGVERRGLLLDRYIASALVAGTFTVLAIASLEILSYVLSKTWLPDGFALSLLAGWEIPVLSITAFPFVFGKYRTFKSLGTGLVFGIFIALSLALFALASYFYGFSVAKMPLPFIALFFLSPINYLALFSSVVYPELGGTISMWFVPPGLQPSYAVLIPAGLLWIILPALLFYYLGNRDY